MTATNDNQPETVNGRVIAWHRAETDPCEAGTPGCAIDHTKDEGDGCETW